MTARSRAQIVTGLVLSALVAAVLTSFAASPAATAAASTVAASPSVNSPRLAPKARLSAEEAAGKKAGRRAGAKAGARTGRKAASVAGAKAAVAGAKAGRRAGAKAGARAGSAAAARGGSSAGAKAGRVAGAKAGRIAGRKVARNAPQDCGPTTYRKVDGSAWQCTLGENFNGNSLNTAVWRVMTSDKFSYGDRPDCFVNDPDNVKVGGGVLTLTARREKSEFNCTRKGKTFRTQYSSGMVSTFEKWTQAYGRFEFRAKLPYTDEDGVQASFWLWPDGASGASWPASGEIDVAEWYSHFPDRVIPYLHYANLLSGGSTNNNCLVNRVQDWHTYLLEWTPQLITISYDGVQCLQRRGGSPFNKAYMVSMFQGFGLHKNKPTSRTPSVNSAQIAWVRVWS